MTHTLKHTLGRSTPSILTSTSNDFSMTHPGIFCTREQKLKNIANKQTFHGHSSFALFLPLGRAKFVLKFSSLFSFPHIYNNVNEYVQQ